MKCVIKGQFYRGIKGKLSFYVQIDVIKRTALYWDVSARGSLNFHTCPYKYYRKWIQVALLIIFSLTKQIFPMRLLIAKYIERHQKPRSVCCWCNLIYICVCTNSKDLLLMIWPNLLSQFCWKSFWFLLIMALVKWKVNNSVHLWTKHVLKFFESEYLFWHFLYTCMICLWKYKRTWVFS